MKKVPCILFTLLFISLSQFALANELQEISNKVQNVLGQPLGEEREKSVQEINKNIWDVLASSFASLNLREKAFLHRIIKDLHNASSLELYVENAYNAQKNSLRQTGSRQKSLLTQGNYFPYPPPNLIRAQE